MNHIKKIATLFALLPFSAFAYSGEFIIDADGGYPESRDTNAYWTDTLKRRNAATGSRENFKYSGIAIVSQDVADNVFIYIKDYSGVDTYNLTGTGDEYDYASANNAVYSHDEPKVPYMVVRGRNGSSRVVVSSDDGKTISGTYKLHVYMDGRTNGSSFTLTGSFDSLPYRKK